MNRLLAPVPRLESRLRTAEDLRAQPIFAVPSLLRELGVDPAEVLARTGIDPLTFDDPEQRLPFETVGRLLSNCSAIAACPCFGLLLGQRSGAVVLGVIGELARQSATVRAGLRSLILHFHLHDRGAAPVLFDRNRSETELAYVIHARAMPGAAQVADGSIAIGFHLLRGLCGPAWTPTEVTFARRRPADIAPYRTFFRAPVRFDARRSALVFSTGWLDQPIAGADPHAQAHLSALVAQLGQTKPAAFADSVRQAVIELMVTDRPSTERIASVFGLSRRTLYRRLEAEGASVHALLTEIRHELARQLLQDSRMPLSEIAATLHYSEPGAFSRAFRGWTGMTPSAFREAARANSPRPG